MSKYFLVKERKDYVKGQDQSLVPGSYDTYDAALNAIKSAAMEADDIIYVVEMVAKCYGNLRQDICSNCRHPAHHNQCGPESLPISLPITENLPK